MSGEVGVAVAAAPLATRTHSCPGVADGGGLTSALAACVGHRGTEQQAGEVQQHDQTGSAEIPGSFLRSHDISPTPGDGGLARGTDDRATQAPDLPGI